MKKIDNIASIDGRLLLHEIYHKLKFERQRSSLSSLLTLWHICTTESEIYQYLNEDINILHKLGFFRGTFLWLEEIVNRYYFSTINSFVYFGAAVLLVLIGLNNFTDKVDRSVVIYGLAFEASMLLLMFFVMLFTPEDDVTELKNKDEDPIKELLDEVGEISRDFAVTSAQLEKISDNFETIITKQNQISILLSEVAKTNAEAVQPNPKMIEIMSETNTALSEFNNTIKQLNTSAEQIKSEEIISTVRKELEKILTQKVNNI